MYFYHRSSLITLGCVVDPQHFDQCRIHRGPFDYIVVGSGAGGIRFARRLTAKLKAEGAIAEEEQPGEARQSDEELKDYIRTTAWGHHASCTCPIGPRENGGVLGSDFRVHGTQGLRDVDACVFPRIRWSFGAGRKIARRD
jgi:choline dehydrogenase-like flavoprotein